MFLYRTGPNALKITPKTRQNQLFLDFPTVAKIRQFGQNIHCQKISKNMIEEIKEATYQQ